MSDQLLSIQDLAVSFQTEEGSVTAVDGVSLELAPGEILAVVGESGSGKSVTAMTLMGLTRSPNATFEGEATYRDTELVGADDETLRKVRGAEIAMIFQDPMTSLNPVQKIGHQIEEQILVHMDVEKTEARERVIELLERVGIPRARDRVDSYPHEFSGGMRQRVMIALALSCDPKLLIADEPTTALDVTIQAQILDRIRAAARRDRRGGDPGHPRPRRGGRHRRPRGRDVRRPDRGAGHARRDLLRPPAPLHVGPAGLDRPRRPRPPRAAAGHRRAAAVAGQPPAGLPLRARAARTRSTSASRRPTSSSAPASPPATWTAAGWTRTPSASCAWSSGQIGLEAPREGVA